MNKKSLDNLIPFDKRTENEQRKIRSIGGITSAKKRRERKAAAQFMEQLLYMPLGDFNEQEKQMLKQLGVKKDKDCNQLCLMLVSLLRKAIAGDVSAVKTVLMLAGQMPAEKTEQQVTVEKSEPPQIEVYFSDSPQPKKLSELSHEQLAELTREAFSDDFA